MDFMNPANLRARFAELGEKRDAAIAISQPLRAQRDLVVSEADKTAKELAKKIATAEEGLFELDQERAMIARALGGRTGQE